MKEFSVIIPVYNRKTTIKRCIDSVIAAGVPLENIIVVDDCSSDETVSIINETFPSINCIEQQENKGVCAARNKGIEVCNTKYAIFLDSDDELCSDAITIISDFIISINLDYIPNSTLYFCRSKTKVKDTKLKILHPEHLINGYVDGNTTEVIHVARFISKQYTFPESVSKVGGEHLLWLQIASEEGIYFCNQIVTIENDDAPNRLTSSNNQYLKSFYHAILQEETIQKFGELYKRYNYAEYLMRYNACSIYYKLSKQMGKALKWAAKSNAESINLNSIFTLLFCCLPNPLAKQVFLKWRSR